MVSLTGRSGVGKTRLATEVARSIAEDGTPVAFVPLGDLRDPGRLLHEIAGAVGAVALPGGPVSDVLSSWIGGAHLLLVLDTMEHLRAAAPEISRLIEACPSLRVLVTTQAPLRLHMEHVVHLLPLPVPGAGVGLVELLDSPSVRLYCERAEALHPDFRLDSRNAGDVGELCRRLEGLPLAIELAAARAAGVPAGMVLRQLDDDPLRLMPSGYRDGPSRHRDLRAALSWTCALLTDDERTLLARLSLFCGSFDASDVVAAAAGCDEDPLDSLSALVDLHLVDPAPDLDPTRFVLPSSVRAIGGELLDTSTEGAQWTEAWRHRCATRARRAALGIDATQPGAWWDWLAVSHETLLAALRHALRERSVEDSLALLSALAPYWDAVGVFTDHMALVEDALALAEGTDPAEGPLAEVRIWSGALGLASTDGVDERWLQRVRDGERLAREDGDDRALLHALQALLMNVVGFADDDTASALAAEGLERARATGDPVWIARFEIWDAMLAKSRSDVDTALALGRSGLAAAAAAGDDRAVVLGYMLLAPLAHIGADVGDIPSAEAIAEIARRSGQTRILAVLLPMLAAEALETDDVDAALRWLHEGLVLVSSLPSSPLAAYTLIATVAVAVAAGDLVAAARFHGMVRGSLPALEQWMAPVHVKAYRAVLRRVRTVLGEDVFEAHAAGGSAVVTGARIREALAFTARHASAPVTGRRRVPGRHNDGPLTARQSDVLRKLVDGLSNDEIARHLRISPKTVMHHTGAIYRKLGVRGRSEAIVWAVRNGADR